MQLDQLFVQVVRYVDDAQPGWVACEFEDADGRRHTIVDKAPVVADKMLDATSLYPQVGCVRCEILSRAKDIDGRELVRITTAKPDGVTTTEDLSEFIVLAGQISKCQIES